MNDNPSLKIELSSHTDARGRESYNQSLSEKRAKSAQLRMCYPRLSFTSNSRTSEYEMLGIGWLSLGDATFR